MNYTFVGRNLAVSSSMKDAVIKKIDRLSRLFPSDTPINVSFSVIRSDNRVEISLPLNKRLLRAEVTAKDMFAAIDSAVDILDKQIVKYKNRLKDKSRRDNSFKLELDSFFKEDANIDETFEDAIKIERKKHFPLKPMDAEEAIMEMELLGHNFFVFRNSESEEINVVYKRHNGYGLIDPNDPIDE